MAFWFQCPVCQSKRLATEGIIGKRVRCADCSNFVEVSRPAPDSHVDQEEIDHLVDDLISEESVVSDAEIDLANREEAKPGGRFREGPIDELSEEDDEDALMEAQPLIDQRGDQSHEIDVEVVDPNSGFALNAPSEEINELVEAASDSGLGSEPVVEVIGMDAAKGSSDSKAVRKELEWKTEATEEDEEWVDPPLLGKKKEREDSEMDMTPMVDVTFLLLIFFMVTASFILQKSMNRPTESVDDPSLTVTEDDEDSEDLVQIDIAADNTYYITLPEEEQIEAPSEQDLRIALANAKEGGNSGIPPKKMLIRAHEESFHGRVITAMDVGADMDLPLQVQITSEDL